MNNKYELQGTIKVIHQAKSYGQSGFTKREFVVTDNDGKYPQDIKFELVKDKCAIIDNFGVGDPVSVSFNIRGNEHNGKHYVSLQAWKIESDGEPLGRRSPEFGKREKQSGSESPQNSGKYDLNDDSEIPF